jgi:DNA-directed RNA polymerase specialized sigma subunit
MYRLGHIYTPEESMGIEKAFGKLSDWLLTNLDEIENYIKEMKLIGSAAVMSFIPGGEDCNYVEQSIIDLEDAERIIQAVKMAVSKFNEREFDVYVDRFQNGLLYSEIANFEEISVITVKRTINKIREIVREQLSQDEISLENVLWLRKRLFGLGLKKVS